MARLVIQPSPVRRNVQILDLDFHPLIHLNRIPEGSRASNNTPIHYYNVTCLGNEDKLVDCELTEGRGEGCSHAWDVAIVCKRSLSCEYQQGCTCRHYTLITFIFQYWYRCILGQYNPFKNQANVSLVETMTALLVSVCMSVLKLSLLGLLLLEGLQNINLPLIRGLYFVNGHSASTVTTMHIARFSPPPPPICSFMQHSVQLKLVMLDQWETQTTQMVQWKFTM